MNHILMKLSMMGANKMSVRMRVELPGQSLNRLKIKFTFSVLGLETKCFWITNFFPDSARVFQVFSCINQS